MKKYILLLSLLPLFGLFTGCSDDNDTQDIVARTNPKLISIIPKAGYTGAAAIISGTNFSEDINKTAVEINGRTAEVTAVTNNRISIILPENPNGEYPVKVTVNGNSVEGLHITYADAPAAPELQVLQLMPSVAYAGDEIMVIGQCFSENANENEVTFNGVKATVTAAEPTKLSVIVPDTEEGSYQVKVKVGGKEATGPVFTYLHTVTLTSSSLSPMSGRPGQEVTIFGEAFSTKIEENIVTINDVPAEVKSAEPDKLVIIVPDNPEGTYPVVITVGDKTVSNLTFTYIGVTYTVKTYVGRIRGNAANGGSCEGFGYEARFQQPDGLAFAPNGDLWFTDRGGHEIRKVTSDKYVHIVKLSGASIKSPWGAAFSPDGYFVTVNKDLNNAVKISQDGVVTEFITGLNSPIGLTYDKKGQIYICDRGTNSIKKYDSDGKLLQTYTGVTAPNAVAIDDKGRMFVVSNSAYKLYMIDVDGTVSTIFGDGKKPTAATFNNGVPGDLSTATIGAPFGIVIDEDGTIYISDTIFHVIRALKPDEKGNYSKGTLTTIAGQPGKTVSDPLQGDGDGSIAKFNYPAEMVIVGNTIYVSDELTWSIRTITKE